MIHKVVIFSTPSMDKYERRHLHRVNGCRGNVQFLAGVPCHAFAVVFEADRAKYVTLRGCRTLPSRLLADLGLRMILKDMLWV